MFYRPYINQCVDYLSTIVEITNVLQTLQTSLGRYLNLQQQKLQMFYRLWSSLLTVPNLQQQKLQMFYRLAMRPQPVYQSTIVEITNVLQTLSKKHIANVQLIIGLYKVFYTKCQRTITKEYFIPPAKNKFSQFIYYQDNNQTLYSPLTPTFAQRNQKYKISVSLWIALPYLTAVFISVSKIKILSPPSNSLVKMVSTFTFSISKIRLVLLNS